ncbi:DNA polymerase III subunit alpha [Atopococcus tabaci]|uniref:DNA polymerase III subunit alpha n=1 Tax=Atopococcus tabaci TaxID=269774 RepID=UPI000425EB9D|nr:DNA polymerase III subunit alpha [Atopococcus tabaci]
MSFVQLQVTSSYSLLQSTLTIEQLVQAAKKRGYSAIALTDRNVLHGLVDFYTYCKKEAIKPILGLTLDLAGIRQTDQEFPIVLLAVDEKGYQSLVKLSSQKMLLEENQLLSPESLRPHTEHLIAITPGREGEIEQALFEGREEEAAQIAQTWNSLFPSNHFYLGVQVHQPLLPIKELLLTLSKEISIPLAGMHDVQYADAEDHFAVQVLRAIDEGVQLEEDVEEKGTYYLPESNQMRQVFSEHGLEDAAAATVSIAERVDVTVPLHRSLLPRYPLEEGVTSERYLKQISGEGLKQRVSNVDRRYVERLEKELSVIIKMGFSDYFLIVWDLMRYARRQQILTGAGRGSAAGSLAAYALGITDVDPIQYDLLFERFLNEERYTLPDIDLDFPDDKREQILRYVKQKYGSDHVAQIATFGTLAAKQAIRDTGRVFGLTTAELSTWSKAIPSFPGTKLSRAWKESKALSELIRQSEQNRKIYDTAKKIEGLPRHVSTHAAGVVISEQPLQQLVPLQKGSGELPLTQYPMGNVETIGLLKMDFLGLKNLTILADTLHFLREGQKVDIDLRTIPLNDNATLDLFRKGDTSGIFQFESDGIRRVLKRLAPTTIEDVVAVNALYRPGPMEQIDVFIKRKKGQEPISYPHPDLEEILGVTYGVMVYQEQIMRVASKMAGYSLGEADILRRAISKKDRKVIDEEREHFKKGAEERGYDTRTAEQVYNYIERFADYGFNRSHSVAYSLIAYQMAYLKTHYPVAFFAALLKSTPANGEKAREYLLEAKQKGVAILGPDINNSGAGFSVQNNGMLFGLEAIKGLRKDFIRNILMERNNRGKFYSMIDFLKRADKRWRKPDYILPLIYSGAFDGLGSNRATLVHSLEGILSSLKLSGDNTELFEVLEPKYEPVPDLSQEEKLEGEFQYTGMYFSGHPSEEYDSLRETGRLRYIQELKKNQTARLLGTIKEVKKIQTKRGEPMAFADISDATGNCSLTFFPEQYRKYGQHLKDGANVVVEGKAELDRGDIKVIVNHVSQPEKWSRENPSLTCYVRIQSEENNYFSEKIQEITKNHSGNIPVILYHQHSGQKYRMKREYWVNGSTEFLQELTQLVGKENVILS